MNSMTSTYWGGRVTLGLPYWTMCDRFDSPQGNVIENELFDIPGCQSVCLNHQCWIEFVFSGDIASYSSYVGKVQKEVDHVLRKYQPQLSAKDIRRYTNI